MAKYITRTFTCDGKRYYVRGHTEEEALQKRDQLEREVVSVGFTQARVNYSVNQWFDEYMSAYKADVKRKTFKDYYSIYNNCIKPYIGAAPLKFVKPIDCQRILNKLADSSYSYVHKTNLLLNSMFETAVDNELIEKNPAKKLAIPRAEQGSRRNLSAEERKTFLTACKHSSNASLFCLIIYYCGLRPSEVCRIQGKDIDKENKVLHVRGEKTKSAVRDVPIPDELKFPSIGKNEMLFHTSTGRQIDPSRVYQYWKSTKRRMEIASGNVPDSRGKITSKYVSDDLTMYCLRHDYCTRLQEAGVPIDVARRLMGHSSVEVTSKIYTHSNKQSFEDAAKRINNYLHK